MVAVPVRWKVASCVIASVMDGGIVRGWAVELKVPLKVPPKVAVLAALKVPESPRVSVYVPEKLLPGAVPTRVRVSVPEVTGKVMVIVRFWPSIVPVGVMGAVGSVPTHFETSLPGHTKVLGDPEKVDVIVPDDVVPVGAKFV